MITYGAYTHSRPDGRIFYVGKGTLTRAKNMKRNDYHDKVVGKYGESNIGVSFIPCTSERIALDLEIGMIKCFRRMGIDLTNRTDGGEGTSGCVYSVESRLRMSLMRKGKKQSPEHLAKRVAAMSGRVMSPEAKAKISAANIGRKQSPETCAKNSAARIGKKRSKESVEKSAAWHRGRKRPPDVVAKLADLHTGRKRSPETCAKISAANTGKKQSPEHIAKRLASIAAIKDRKGKTVNGIFLKEGDKNDL